MAPSQMSMKLKLTGPDRLTARIDAYERQLLPAMTPALNSLAVDYRSQVADAFSRKHGRSGQTAEGSHVLPAVPDPLAIQAKVRFQDNVGFVISRLPAHTIVSKGAALANPQPYAPGVGRVTNLYGPFGPVRVSRWYQGGERSYSPDRKWYETDAKPWLDTEARLMLSRLGPLFQALANEELGAGTRVVLTGL